MFQVDQVLVQMVIDGQSPVFIDEVLTVLPGQRDIVTVYKDALTLVTQAFR